MNRMTRFNPTKPLIQMVSLSVMLSLAFAPGVRAEEEVLPEYTFMDAVKTGKNLTSFRLRYEHVSQDGNAPTTPAAAFKDADALTLRSLIGWQTAPYKNFSFAFQATNVSKLNDDFNDGTSFTPINAASNQPDKLAYAKVVDPDDTNINQAFIDWTGIKNTKFRLGRQIINLDNVRFIGDIAFRQVTQTFDGLSVTTKVIPNTEVFLAHIEAVNQINSRFRNQGALDIVNAKYFISPTETFSGYGYFSRFDDLGFGNAWFGAGAANARANQSNKTLGVRLDGIHPFNPNVRALYTAEFAKQSDYSGGDQRIDADYYRIGAGGGYNFLNVRIDQESLGSNDNDTFAFQTPFGTNHLFQGWVDKFLVTPRTGIKDTFVTATYRLNDFLFFADYHWINSDSDFAKVGGGRGDSYGQEWNVAVTYNVSKQVMTKLEYGQYTEDDQLAAGRIRDTEKLWLTAMYSF